ncbi:MAG: endonuclease/exonuclease/phosphatase family protein [Ignavibacteria bacterium]|nr:endonuclease/exonuclease/phosphatase family protein [Ignavibacteria bacterium]
MADAKKTADLPSSQLLKSNFDIITVMNIKIASWNLESRLGNTTTKNRGTPQQIIENIKSVNADILFLPDAYKKISADELKVRTKELNSLGYKTYSVPYDDNINLRQKSDSAGTSLVLLSKLPITVINTIRLGSYRNALHAVIEVNEKVLNIFGIHLDDIHESMRVTQINDLTRIINSTGAPVIVMGDFNAMHGEDFWPASFFRSKFAKMLSKIILPDVFIRVTEMASGEALKLLEVNTDLSDVDKRHRPTTTPKMREHEWMPSIKLIQIDHIYTSPGITTSNFHIHSDGGSDHRAISVVIEI